MNRTKAISHFYFGNDIRSLQGKFVYRKFEPFEQVDEQLSYKPHYVKSNEQYPRVYPKSRSNVPRYVSLEWEGDDINLNLLDGVTDFIQGENIFFNSDLQQEAILYSNNEQKAIQHQSELISDLNALKEKSKLDYLLSQTQSNEFTEQIEQDLNAGGARTSVPVLEPTTNRPIQQSESPKQPSPDILIDSKTAPGVIGASYRSPFTGEDLNNQLGVARLISKKVNGLQTGKYWNTFYESFVSSDDFTKDNFFVTSLEKLDSQERDLLSKRFILLGYAILKYRLEGNEKYYMYTRFVARHEYIDPYVAYGKSYQYELRPIYGTFWNAKVGNLFIVSSDESTTIDIECTELRIPEPPTSMQFSYQRNGQIRASWGRPSSYVQDMGKRWDTDDIKGYQIFYRHSLYEPYRLVKYFKFNNTTPENYRIYSHEYTPDSLVVSYETKNPEKTDNNGAPIYPAPGSWILEIRPNTDYYFTMCSIDAHGNSSNYGTQYQVRRDNVTGEVAVKIISPPGAPKQYPNLKIPNKLVQPVMKVSGYSNMDIYYNPDTKYSKPNSNTGKASVNFQLFELETQTEENIKITITESQN